MTTKERILAIRLSEKMDVHPECAAFFDFFVIPRTLQNDYFEKERILRHESVQKNTQ